MTPLDDRDPIDVLAEDFADRLRRGEHPSVSDYARANPDHAEQLRELLPAVAQMEFLKRFRRASGTGDTADLPDRFGDFRIVRELGRGGMGIVFEAVQESLGRPVALKVLATHAQLQDIRRTRFIREAQAAAKLHHTNIVPVFGVGEQDGMPYYVMQLIRGEGLHSVLARWRGELGIAMEAAGSTVEFGQLDTHRDHPAADDLVAPSLSCPCHGDWTFVAEIGMQAADALHYAHKQGVLHRDVKPANLILDPARRVWVADFGLAKLVDTHALTATGDIVGTLQYLAPECLAGESDARSDVYGLGATLYELLTLQPPYPMESPARLVKQVADADPLEPHQLNSRIPRDLETIVLKAMAREPRRRYATAGDLAHDLQAFLEDRPITARRESWVGRGWRWCRRNPTTAILSAGVIAAFVLAGVVGWVGYANTKRALAAEASRVKEAEDARADAVKARNDAELLSTKLEANLKISLQAFGKVFEAAAGARPGFGAGPWGRPPGLGGRGAPGFVTNSPPGPSGAGRGPGFAGGPFADDIADKSAILEEILAFYDKFAEQNSTNPRLQLEAAKARRRVGEAQGWFGQAEKSAASFRRARAILEVLHSRDPANDAVRTELVNVYLFAPFETFGSKTEGMLLRALGLARLPAGNARPNLVGSVWSKLGWVREHTGNESGAEVAYRAAIAELTVPPDLDDLRPPPVIAELAFARDRLATLLIGDDNWSEARQLIEESVDDLRAARARFSTESRPPREITGLLATTLLRSADLRDELDPGAAGAARREARELPDRGGFGPPKIDGPQRKR